MRTESGRRPVAIAGASQPTQEDMPPPDEWLLLVYRPAPEASNSRIAVWRELKRLGALYLQQCVCVEPPSPACIEAIQTIAQKIETAGGSCYLFHAADAVPGQAARIVDGFRELSVKEYEELLGECKNKFEREVEFERFRGNFVYGEVDELRGDLERLQRWSARIVERDLFDAGYRVRAAEALAQCTQLLEEFEEEVYRRGAEASEPSESQEGQESAS